MVRPLVLTLRSVSKPEVASLDAVAKKQLEFVLGPTGSGLKLTDLYSVHDATGAHLYDMHLYCGDDGQVFVKGTTKNVATFSQGGACCDDARLQDALDDALARFLAAKKPTAKKPAAKKTAAKKPAAKKTAAKKTSAKKSNA